MSLPGTNLPIRNVRFSNRPFGVKRFQTIHHYGVDVAHGLVLLYGIGTKAVPSWDSKTGWNNLSGGLVVSVTTGPSGSTISPHPARDIIPPLSGARASSYWIRCYIVFMLLLISAIAARTALPETERLQSERLPLRYCRRVRQRGSSAPWHAAKNHAPGYAQVASG